LPSGSESENPVVPPGINEQTLRKLEVIRSEMQKSEAKVNDLQYLVRGLYGNSEKKQTTNLTSNDFTQTMVEK
jgi:hypothetical protein